VIETRETHHNAQGNEQRTNNESNEPTNEGKNSTNPQPHQSYLNHISIISQSYLNHISIMHITDRWHLYHINMIAMPLGFTRSRTRKFTHSITRYHLRWEQVSAFHLAWPWSILHANHHHLLLLAYSMTMALTMVQETR